jgi:hypothetical protein
MVEPTGVARPGRLAPETLFLILSLIGGLVIVGLITPLVGGNEVANFQRAASIASGHLLVEPAPLPGGIAELLDRTAGRFPEGSEPPYSLSRAEFRELSQIPLGADRPRLVPPNPIAVLHPICYLPQAPVIALGIALGLPPLAIFYLGRLAGLVAGIALTFLAIRIMPVRKTSLAAIALLPPILFSRSTLDADQLTNGLAFLFFALVVGAIAGRGDLRPRTIAALALAAFLLAQAKSAYFLLPLFVLAIPVERFRTTARKALACAIICVPGIVASVGWMLVLKFTYFTAARYGTWSGTVEPARQLHFVLTQPLDYAAVVARTLFGTMFLPRIVTEFLGSFGPPVLLPIVIVALIAALLAAMIMADRGALPGPLQRSRTRLLALAIAAATVLIILTLLYLQWTRLGGRVIDGFNGRYLYPLAPLLLVEIPARRTETASWAPRLLPVLGLVSVTSTCWMTWRTYFG